MIGGRVRVALDPPAGHRLADLVDDLVGLLARRPPNVERQLRRLLLGLRDRDEELGQSAAVATSPVGWLSAPKTKWRAGSTNGELMTGFSIVPRWVTPTLSLGVT